MEVKSVILLIIIAGVKSDCDTYIQCVGSFFDNIFTNNNTFTENDTRSDVVVPEFENININSHLYNILSGVSGFLREELTSGLQFGPPINIFHNFNNDTAIYVKTITVTDDLDNIANIDDGFDEFNLDNTTFYAEIVNDTQEIVLDLQTNNTTVSKLRKKFHENEIPDTEFVIYDDVDDNSTDYPIIDYLDLYKDTTNEYIDVEASTVYNEGADLNIRESNNGSVYIAENCTANGNISQLLFPWVAAIFIKNETTLQYDYYCDGASVSKNIVVTAARCLQYYGKWTKSEDILVLFDKTSLITMNEKERAVKVNNTIIHENFTTTENDLALLVMEEPLDHQFPCLGQGGSDHAYTTGWAISGALTLISFDTGKRSECDETNTFSAFYDKDVTVCPSYGGIYVERQTDSSTWFLRGIRSADPTDRGLCVNHNITFTDLTEYLDWITLYIE